MPRGVRQQRDCDAKQTVEAEFFQHSRMQHRGRRGRGGVGLRRPCVERKERNQDSKTDKQEKVDGVGVRGVQFS